MTCSVFERQGSTLASSVVCNETINKILESVTGRSKAKSRIKRTKRSKRILLIAGKVK